MVSESMAPWGTVIVIGSAGPTGPRVRAGCAETVATGGGGLGVVVGTADVVAVVATAELPVDVVAPAGDAVATLLSAFVAGVLQPAVTTSRSPATAAPIRRKRWC
jgi:hypothetical protein